MTRSMLMLAAMSVGLTAFASPIRQAPPSPTVEAVLLAVDRMLEARWYPRDPQLPSGLTADQHILQAALAAPEASVRAVAVRSVGRFENPSDLPTLIPFLQDPDLIVRHEAANAIVQAAHRSYDQQVQKAITALIQMPRDAVIEEALASLPYGGSLPVVVESLPPRLLVRVLRAETRVRLSLPRLKALHDLVRIGGRQPDPYALEILLRQRDYDLNELWNAARFRCPNTMPGAVPGSCGWETRLVLAQLLSATDASMEPILTLLGSDPVFQVRLAALRQLAVAISQTRTCRPLINALIDSSEAPVVKVEAIRLLEPRCEEREDIAVRLTILAGDLSSASGETPWVATRALEALPRFDPAQALRIVSEQASSHPLPFVRVSAARVAATLKDEGMLARLAADTNDNVRSEALAGLADIGSKQASDFALLALDGSDHRLVATAAGALAGTPERDKAAVALVATLKRLTKEGKDTSRETRLAILTRLDELARVKVGDASMLTSFVDDLMPFLKDFDPIVAGAAASTISVVRSLGRGAGSFAQPTHRAPQQPREDELRLGPAQATIVMANSDRIVLDLLSREAPITVARFVKLVRQRYYDNTEFYRIAPLIVAQGGSPGNNDYSGDARFVRDELGVEHHTRGSVGMMTHGRDTGNMQFFIDLLDQPGFDHEYTVFARVHPSMQPRTGMAAVDALVEGARILQITLSGQ